MVSLDPVKMEGVKTATKSRLSKTKKLEKALTEEREKANECRNRLMYLQADFENYRKRTERRMDEVARFSNEKIIVNLLSIIDEMEMAIQAGKKTKNKKALLKGIEMILKKIYTILELEGLVKIESVGKIFDPKLHEVFQKVPTKDYDENIIIDEIRKGFMLRGKVIRPSMVKTATRVVMTCE